MRLKDEETDPAAEAIREDVVEGGIARGQVELQRLDDTGDAGAGSDDQNAVPEFAPFLVSGVQLRESETERRKQ